MYAPLHPVLNTNLLSLNVQPSWYTRSLCLPPMAGASAVPACGTWVIRRPACAAWRMECLTGVPGVCVCMCVCVCVNLNLRGPCLGASHDKTTEEKQTRFRFTHTHTHTHKRKETA